jgi:hypothetical protein
MVKKFQPVVANGPRFCPPNRNAGLKPEAEGSHEQPLRMKLAQDEAQQIKEAVSSGAEQRKAQEQQ